TSIVAPLSACTHSPPIRLASRMKWLIFWSMDLPPSAALMRRSWNCCRHERSSVFREACSTPADTGRSIFIGRDRLVQRSRSLAEDGVGYGQPEGGGDRGAGRCDRHLAGRERLPGAELHGEQVGIDAGRQGGGG